MKRLLIAAALVATSTVYAADVGVSINFGQPGFYGRIDIGDYPPPRVLYRKPVIIERVKVIRPPIYLHVPPGYARNWRKHCHEYNACNERVYFVHDTWYQREYVPRYQERHGDRRDGRPNDGNDGRGRDEHRSGKDRGNSGGNGNHR